MRLREQWIRPLDALPLDYQHVIAITSSGQEEEMYLVDDKWHIVDGVRIPIEFVVFWHEKREQSTVEMAEDCVKRDDAQDIMARLLSDYLHDEDREKIENANAEIGELPSVQPQPKSEDMGEVSDGYHTFNQLYHQRAILFATIVNQNKDRAWKSYKHEDGKYCFDKDGEWFIVGIDTPLGSYTYHYSKEYWDYFDCEELECGKPWDGHTEEDVTRLLSLLSVTPQPKRGKWIFNENMHDYCCSECGCLMPNVNEYYRKKIIGCPYCLADMRDIRETGITAKEGMEIAKAFHDGIMAGFAESEDKEVQDECKTEGKEV